MATTFSYSVLMAVPDARRGERVNVGIMVFRPGGIDVRMTEMGKLRALTGSDWSSYAEGVKGRLQARFGSSEEAKHMVEAQEAFDPVLRATQPAWFVVDSLADYEASVRQVLSTLVIRPKAVITKQPVTRINTEIARELKAVDALAESPDEPMEEHRVVRDFLVEDELKADFAQRNGVLRVAATLDLRKPHVSIKDATLKAIVLDRAKKVYGSDTKRVGIYAAPPSELERFPQHLELMHDYSDEVYNWAVPAEKNAFMAFVRAGFSALA